MWNIEEVYEKYDNLLPSKYEGGYLIISLYQKIKIKQLENHFSTEDIKIILEEIAIKYGQNISQSERIIKSLLHFFLRNVPNEYGQFYLTDHAEKLIELMINKLNNPYKNFPLAKSFNQYFTIHFNEFQSITDLELKFGREFVAPHKRIINDHLESLEDELSDSYAQLNDILHSNNQDATSMVKKFADVFKKFGDRAEDITNAISSKDIFLRRLRMRVDEFYAIIKDTNNPKTEEEKNTMETLQQDWVRAVAIYNDLESFFKTIDFKIDHIRKQILNASSKLTELQEHFSAKSNFRLLIKRLFHLSMDCAYYDKGSILFKNGFNIKEMVFEKVQIFYPEYHDFLISKNNTIVSIPDDQEYEHENVIEIEKEIKRQEIIHQWINIAKEKLEFNTSLKIEDLMNEIIDKESDFTIAQNVVIELTQYAAERNEYKLAIIQSPVILKNKNLLIWKMRIEKIPVTVF
jgi:hypothetical protein